MVGGIDRLAHVGHLTLEILDLVTRAREPALLPVAEALLHCRIYRLIWDVARPRAKLAGGRRLLTMALDGDLYRIADLIE